MTTASANGCFPDHRFMPRTAEIKANLRVVIVIQDRLLFEFITTLKLR
ncbi:hypothetical protein [Aquamicrobium terrae]|uniref:Uncharacterized protein n=1 Tax=Aquamicrobium terrae TaxID=1324945 RepID=A0ABV2N2G6_9HYPH